MGRGYRLAIIVSSVVVAAWILFPILWMFSISLQTEPEIHSVPPTLWPKNPNVFNYWFIFDASSAIEARLQESGRLSFLPAVARWFPNALANSVIIGLVITVINIIAATLASYTFTRIRFRGSGLLFYMSVAGRLIPPVAIVVPYYIIIQNFFGLNLLDTLFAVILVHAAFTLPINIWILNTYLSAIPSDIEDAARVDGYGRLETLFKVVLPVILPGIVAIGIISFMVSWGEFFFAFMVTQTQQSRTLPVIVGFMAAQPYKPVGILMAGGLVAMLPALVMIAIFRRYLLKGLVAGAVR
ncbi:MAG: carbohydrate ABC transporter permease [Candidatus Caldarchaeum sp.]